MRSRLLLYSAVFLLLCSMFAQDEKNHWFTTGNKFTFVIYDANGEIAGKYDAQVMKSYTSNDTTFSESTSTWYDKNSNGLLGTGTLNYSHDSSTFISQISNLLPTVVHYDTKTTVQVTGTPVIYPLRPKFDMQLPDASGTIEFAREAGGTRTRYMVTKRTIMNRDTLSGKFGDIPCWIVSSEESTELLSIKQKQKPNVRQMKEWYSPEYGVVKTEYSKDGKVEQVRVLVAVNQ